MDGLGNSTFGQQLSSKEAIINQIKQEAALNNAKQLLEKIKEHCFEKCIPKPGTSLSSGESSCLTQCMEKYFHAYNTVNKQYTSRLNQELARSTPGGSTF